jgi:hypothetical protein
VEELVFTDTIGRVYNLRVADFHTYFVGDKAWRFSLWAHNADLTYSQKEQIARDWIESKNQQAANPTAYNKASYAQRMKIRAIAKKLIKQDPTLLQEGASLHGNFPTNTPGVRYKLVRLADDPARKTAGFKDFKRGSTKKIGETIDAFKNDDGTWTQKRYTKAELKEWNVAFVVVEQGPQIKMRTNETAAIKAYEKRYGHRPELNENNR